MAKWRDVKQQKVNNKINEKETQEIKQFPCASLPKRLKSFLTDSFLITTPITYIIMYLILGGGTEFAENRTMGWSLILSISAFIIIFFWYVKFQTPGMKAYGVKIVSALSKDRISFSQAVIRYIATLFAMISIFLMFLPFFNKDKKTFQDIISNTIIINE